MKRWSCLCICVKFANSNCFFRERDNRWKENYFWKKSLLIKISEGLLKLSPQLVLQVKISILAARWISSTQNKLYKLNSFNFGEDVRLTDYFSEIEALNPLMTNVPHHIETSQLICNANQLTGFYMMGNIGR